MMGRWVLTGAMTLIALELVTRNDRTAGAVGGALAGVAAMARRFMDPRVPAIPERGSSTSSTTDGPALTGWIGDLVAQAAGNISTAATAATAATRYPDPTVPNLRGARP